MADKSKNLGFKIAIIILIALLIGAGFYGSKMYQKNQDEQEKLIAEKELVLKDLTEMSNRYEAAIIKNDSTSAKLQVAKSRIEALIKDLNKSKATASNLSLYKNKYLELQKEMDALLIENDRLKMQNQVLTSTLDSTQVKLQANAVLTDSLLHNNIALKKVVADAAVLSAVGLKGFGVIARTSGKLIPTERARRTDKLRVCFSLVKNSFVEPGDKELYIQVIDPNNNTLGANKQIQFGEMILNYSTISKFNYEQKTLDICEFVSGRNKKFEKGTYFVNVFNRKELIASNQFTLK